MLIILIRTTIIYIFVLAILRFTGKRQLGELQASEFVTTMIISNLASISIEQQSIPLLVSMLPVVIIACYEILLSGITIRSAKFERFIEGEPRIIMKNGIFVQKTLRMLRFTVTDILCALRDKNIFDPTSVSIALIEPNGKLSVYATGYSPKNALENPPACVIVEGMIINDALKMCGKTDEWLNSYLDEKNILVKEVLLMLVYKDGNIFLNKYDFESR